MKITLSLPVPVPYPLKGTGMGIGDWGRAYVPLSLPVPVPYPLKGTGMGIGDMHSSQKGICTESNWEEMRFDTLRMREYPPKGLC